MDWRALEQQVDRTINAAFGETVRLAFFKKGLVDTDRPAVEVRAILHVGGNDSISSFGDGMRTRLAQGKAELFIERATYAGLVIRTDDKVRALTRIGQPWFMVSSVNDRDTSLLTVSLNEM